MRELAESNSHVQSGPDVWPLAFKEKSNPAGVLTVTEPCDGEFLANVETAGAQQVQESLESGDRIPSI